LHAAASEGQNEIAELLIAGAGLGLLLMRGKDAEKWLVAAVILGFLGIYLVIGKVVHVRLLVVVRARWSDILRHSEPAQHF